MKFWKISELPLTFLADCDGFIGSSSLGKVTQKEDSMECAQKLTSELVRSLFCGLPRLENRMAVFVAASDERYSGGNCRDKFFYGGFLAPFNDWAGPFAEQWDANVLAGPPRIPYLHMTDIRKRAWRESEGNGISRTQGERRVRSAFELISEMPSLTPIGTDLNAGHLLDTFTKKIQVQTNGGKARKRFKPDYLSFLAYVYLVLEFCDRKRPDAEKVDFVVERNGEITNHIQEFYETMPSSLESIGAKHLIPLLGELIPGGKDRAPLQAADVLCWYSQRFREGELNDKDTRRYKVIATRQGVRVDFTDPIVTRFWEAITDGSEAV